MSNLDYSPPNLPPGSRVPANLVVFAPSFPQEDQQGEQETTATRYSSRYTQQTSGQ